MVVRQKITSDDIAELYLFIAHGDQKHRAWLLRALIAWADGSERPRIDEPGVPLPRVSLKEALEREGL